jgi:hypothetical protein
MNADATAALLKLVAEDERRRCRDTLAEAEVEARTALRDALRAARARMRGNVLTLKQERRQALALASAELDTARRQHQQRCDQALLVIAWEPLRAALLARWNDAATRRLWVEGLVRRALARLPRTAWRVEHAPDWPATEQARFSVVLTEKLGEKPNLQVADDIAGGLRVHADTALLDGTLDGLLADRRAVEALLLAEMTGTPVR